MRFTLFPNLSGREAQTIETTWPALVEWLTNPAIFHTKKAAPLIKLGVFGDKRSADGSLRTDENLLAISGVEGDYDGGVMQPETAAALMREAGVVAAIFTTGTHSPDFPKWRVLVPLTKEYPPSERDRFLEYVNAILGGVLTKESFTLSQAFFIGRVEGVPYAVH